MHVRKSAPLSKLRRLGHAQNVDGHSDATAVRFPPSPKFRKTRCTSSSPSVQHITETTPHMNRKQLIPPGSAAALLCRLTTVNACKILQLLQHITHLITTSHHTSAKHHTNTSHHTNDTRLTAPILPTPHGRPVELLWGTVNHCMPHCSHCSS